jgi:hypothetical protein
MKNSNLNFIVKNTLLFTLVIAVLILLNSCAKKINFQTSQVVPAARGTVKVKKDDNKNYGIKINLWNLAEAKRLPTSEKTYVVWMESDQQAVKNLGQLNSGRSRLSKKLKASFETVSPVKPTKIFITAEDNSGVQYPGNELILTTNGF